MESRIGKVIKECYVLNANRRQMLIYGCTDIKDKLDKLRISELLE